MGKEVKLTPVEYIEKNMKNVFIETQKLLEALYAARVEEITEYCKTATEAGNIKIGGVAVKKNKVMQEHIVNEIIRDIHATDICRCMALVDQIEAKQELLNKIKQDVQ